MIFSALLLLSAVYMPEAFAFKDPLGPGRWWQRPFVRDRLKLDSDQIDRINSIWTDYRKKLIDIDGLIKKEFLDLENLLTRPAIDRQEAYKIAESIGQLQARHRTEQIKMAIDIRQELSQGQFQKLEELKRELMKRIKKKRFPEHGRPERLENQ